MVSSNALKDAMVNCCSGRSSLSGYVEDFDKIRDEKLDVDEGLMNWREVARLYGSCALRGGKCDFMLR